MKLFEKNESGASANKVYLQFKGEGLTGKLSENLSTAFESFKTSERFESKAGSLFVNEWVEDGKLVTGAVVQAGSASLKDVQKAAKAVGQLLSSHKLTHVEVILSDLTSLDEIEDKNLVVRVFTESLSLTAYKFDTYKTADKKESELDVHIVLSGELSASFAEGNSLAAGTKIAKMMVNEPANVMLPEAMADEAVLAGKTYGFEVKVLEEEAIDELYMPAYMNVAKASENKPRLIIMEYKGNTAEPDEILGLVGKGLSFDTGGYSLKPPTGMINMKSDMGGAAAVVGAMASIANQKLKVNVTAVIAACENMVSGGAYRPGDIIDSRGGKTIFIKSTDAEGRLTLIDAIDYIIKDLKVKRVVDIATLTGAQVIALGGTVTGAVSNNDDFWAMMESASKHSGENVWRMPLFEEIVDSIKHKEADLCNAVREAGMITAGAFIGAFVGDTPWIHLDIAGPSFTEKPLGLTSYGATGVGVKSLYFLAKAFEA